MGSDSDFDSPLFPVETESTRITIKTSRSITALCLDSESTRTSLPDSLQFRDTNRVYFFVSVIDFYEERVCLENLCCVFLIVTIDLPFLPPGISTLVYYMVTLEFKSGLNPCNLWSVDGIHASMLPILFGSMVSVYQGDYRS